MRVITLGIDADGKVSLLHGPELPAAEHRAARFAARDKMPKGLVKLESYSLEAGNRLGVAVADEGKSEGASRKSEKKPHHKKHEAE